MWDAGLFGEVECVCNVVWIVPTLEGFEVSGVEGLRTDGDSVDLCFADALGVEVDELVCDCFWVALDGELLEV